MFVIVSCEQGGSGGGGEPDTPSLMVLSPTNLSETGFQLNWTLNTLIGFTSISVEIAKDKEMETKVKYLAS